MQDWGTNTWSDILPVMEGVETFNYMLVPEVLEDEHAESSTAPQQKEATFYQKQYTPPWIEFYDDAGDLSVQSWPSTASANALLKGGLCQGQENEENPCGTLYIVPPKADQNKEVCINTLRTSDSQKKLTPEELIASCPEQGPTYKYNTPPSPPIAVVNQTVRQKCALIEPENCNPAQQNKFVEHMCNNLDTRELCAGNSSCTWSTENKDVPLCSAKTVLSTPTPEKSYGVCYDSSANMQGLPAVRACLATAQPGGGGSRIPPFGAQLACLNGTNKKGCNKSLLDPQYAQQYTCAWQLVETQDTCSQHKTLEECKASETGTCAWDPCQWSDPGSRVGGVCQSSPNATALINANVDPMMWTIYTNYQHDSTQMMACTPDSTDCTQQSVKISSPNSIQKPFLNPEICSSETRASHRKTVPGTTLNGIPFCAHRNDR